MSPHEHIRQNALLYASRLRARLGPRVQAVRLFGSWAKGSGRADSDVDVWVLVDELDRDTRHIPFELAAELLVEQGVDISPMVVPRAEWEQLIARERRIARDISNEGVPL